MNGTNRGAIRAYAAFSDDFIDLIVKDYPLDLFEDPFPILEAQPDGSPPYKELTLAQARSPTTTPMFCG